MALIRSIIHMLWMAITVVPYTLAIVLGSLFGMRGTSLYRIARAWLLEALRPHAHLVALVGWCW